MWDFYSIFPLLTGLIYILAELVELYGVAKQSKIIYDHIVSETAREHLVSVLQKAHVIDLITFSFLSAPL